MVNAQQEIEPKQQFRVQCNNQTYMAEPHARYTKYTAVAKQYQVALFCSRFLTFVVFVRNGPHTSRWKGCVPPFRLRRPRDITLTPSRKGTLHRIYTYTQYPTWYICVCIGSRSFVFVSFIGANHGGDDVHRFLCIALHYVGFLGGMRCAQFQLRVLVCTSMGLPCMYTDF